MGERNIILAASIRRILQTIQTHPSNINQPTVSLPPGIPRSLITLTGNTGHVPGSTEQKNAIKECNKEIKALIQAQEAIPPHIQTLERVSIDEIASDIKTFNTILNEATTVFTHFATKGPLRCTSAQGHRDHWSTTH